jgi:hypothetical protein
MNYSEIYFAVASVSTILVAGLLLLILAYILAIMIDIKRLSKIAKNEAELIARGLEKGASLLGGRLSDETAGFVKTVFAILLSQFAGSKKSHSHRTKKETKETEDI